MPLKISLTVLGALTTFFLLSSILSFTSTIHAIPVHMELIHPIPTLGFTPMGTDADLALSEPQKKAFNSHNNNHKNNNNRHLPHRHSTQLHRPHTHQHQQQQHRHVKNPIRIPPSAFKRFLAVGNKNDNNNNNNGAGGTGTDGSGDHSPVLIGNLQDIINKKKQSFENFQNLTLVEGGGDIL